MTLATASVQGAPSVTAADEVRVCHVSLPVLGGVSVEETAEPDGRVVSTAFEWDARTLVKRTYGGAGGQPVTFLKWPGKHLFREEPFNWSHGSLDLFNVERLSKRERWTQVFVDRDDSLPILDGRGTRILNLMVGSHLAAVPVEREASSAVLRLDDLLVWGASASAITLQKVAWRSPEQGVARVLGTYRLDMDGLRSSIATLRREVEAWRAGLGDRRDCALQLGLGHQVIINDRRASD